MEFLSRLPFDLDLLPKPLYLVGGAVRDGLIGRVRAELDLDLVVPVGAVSVARQLATEYRAGFVLLDAERQIARVVFSDLTVDIAQQQGDTIECDLARRDYTLNAIGYDLQRETIIDPFNGSQDICQRTIRMVSRENLIDDPLRLFRAYRQGAQLNFTIESATQTVIRQLAELATTIAAERVLVELRYLLQTPASSHWLGAMVADGILAGWLVVPVRADFAQRLSEIDRSIELIKQHYPALDREIDRPLRDTIDISRRGIAKLMAILSPELSLAIEQMGRLTFSSAEIQVVTTVINNLSQLIRGEMSVTEQYFWFLAVGQNFPLLIILAIANGVKLDSLTDLIDRYLDPANQVAHPTPLVTGNDIMQALQISPSPQIGKLLTEIQLARIRGQVTTQIEAIQFARQFNSSFLE